MSRRMDREGVMRSHTQYTKNMRTWNDPRCKEDERGWVQPFSNWQGWDEFNHASYALRSLLLFKTLKLPPSGEIFREDGTIDRSALHRSMDLGRAEGDLRSFHFHIARSQLCDRPNCP